MRVARAASGKCVNIRMRVYRYKCGYGVISVECQEEHQGKQEGKAIRDSGAIGVGSAMEACLELMVRGEYACVVVAVSGRVLLLMV